MTKTIRVLLGGIALAAVVSSAGVAHAEAPKKETTITLEKAERIALARVPGGTITEIEIERHAGRKVYEIEVRATDGREHDLVIDASDGRVISEDIDD
ncbi:MAG TPA: PepSY domain-containing protein [Nannocystaceae bacterium]|nr:PepSY domain-containing protein [Nannocystaceae bacterium]